MDELIKIIEKVKLKKNLTDTDIAQILNISEDKVVEILSGKVVIDDGEVDGYIDLLKQQLKCRKFTKVLDLIFRFSSTVLALVVLLLAINGYSNTSAMIALLAVGLACTTITNLPKIDK